MKINISEVKLHELTRKIVQAKLEEEIESIGGANISVNLMNDHAHLLVQLPQIIAPDEIVNHLADSTSELVDGMGRNEKLVWEEDFGVVSVSKSHLEIVTKYVETQVERHASGNINETLERISSAD
jgi:REP element-mobilizing transposase RayT